MSQKKHRTPPWSSANDTHRSSLWLYISCFCCLLMACSEQKQALAQEPNMSVPKPPSGKQMHTEAQTQWQVQNLLQLSPQTSSQDTYIIRAHDLIKAYKIQPKATSAVLADKAITVINAAHAVFDNAQSVMLDAGDPSYTIMAAVKRSSYDLKLIESGDVLLLKNCKIVSFQQKTLRLNECSLGLN